MLSSSANFVYPVPCLFICYSNWNCCIFNCCFSTLVKKWWTRLVD